MNPSLKRSAPDQPPLFQSNQSSTRGSPIKRSTASDRFSSSAAPPNAQEQRLVLQTEMKPLWLGPHDPLKFLRDFLPRNLDVEEPSHEALASFRQFNYNPDGYKKEADLVKAFVSVSDIICNSNLNLSFRLIISMSSPKSTQASFMKLALLSETGRILTANPASAQTPIFTRVIPAISQIILFSTMKRS